MKHNFSNIIKTKTVILIYNKTCTNMNIQNNNAIDENNFDDDNCGNKDGDKTE